MTVDISIFNLTVVIAAGGLGLLYLLLSNRIYREHFLTFNFTFLVLCIFMVGLATVNTVNNTFHNIAHFVENSCKKRLKKAISGCKLSIKLYSLSNKGVFTYVYHPR
jgi:hypothetical protein